jgi:hypothetical protein
MRRGAGQPAWRWLDWVHEHVQEPGSPFLWPVYAAEGVVMAARWTAYKVARRRDWIVVVQPGPGRDYEKWRAEVVTVCTDQTQAAQRAEAYAKQLTEGWTPSHQ